MTKTQDTIELFEQFVMGNYTRLPVVILRGEGSYVWDAEGQSYLDLFPGWGVDIIGHCHPKVVEAVRRQVGELLHVANNFYMEPQGRLARMISERSFGGQCFFCNSGAEAVEAAIKLARIHTPPERYKIITFENSFHGRTLGAMTATAQTKYHRGFEPVLQGFRYCRFNDLASVEEALDDETCAIMVEPIQGEGGVNVASGEFLEGLRSLCDERGLLLIFDEVQTCAGRTGSWFAHVHFGVEPDLMTMAKGIGGGVAIGVLEAVPSVAKSLAPGTHASTFGGNPIACAAAIATLEAIEEEGMLNNIKAINAYALQRLEAMKEKYAFIRDVRGIGGMIGVELDRPGANVAQRCLEKRLLINCTHDIVIRMLPALNVTEEEMACGLDILDQVFGLEE